MLKYMIIGAFAASSLFAGPAAAQSTAVTDGIVRAIPVRYSDLDLSRGDEASMMLSRLRYAAMSACRVQEISQPGPALRRVVETCRAEALNRAVARLSEPELTRQHQALRR